ncbi:MAG: sugar transferase [Bacteroidales bacterium]|nr:sugar transferase [Bacteroidales bacterium]
MNSYIHYVHDVNDNSSRGFFGRTFRKTSPKVTEILQNFNHLQRAIINASSPRIFEFVSSHLDLEKYYRHIIFSTKTKSYTDDVDFSNVRAIINFKKINNVRYINEHLRSVNTLLPDAGIYIGRVETYWDRKLRLYNKFGRNIGRILWVLDFFTNRFIPRVRIIDRVYSFLTRGRQHAMSQAEILGRLVYSGFDIIDYRYIDGLFYFAVIKTRLPSKNRHPSYHPLIRLWRIGKGGKLIGIYKFRTMHPYSEFLQDFVLKLNGYSKVGKPANDFRVTRWGKWMRKLWIDELPQIINLIKGDMKLVGIRPISRVFFNEYTEEIREKRIKHKPGCVPPYVAYLMQDVDDYIESEIRYMNEWEKSPFLTDIRIFFKAFYNIVTNKIRSK